MRIERITLHLVRLPLIDSFRTSSSEKSEIRHILVQVVTDRADGWGECASPADPYFNGETVETCWHVLKDFLAPAVLGREWEHVGELMMSFAPIKRNHFAKAGLEMACWDSWGKSHGKSLASILGATRTEIESGVSLGIADTRARLFSQIDRYLEEGYKRVKLKIAPGKDVSVVRDVRERYPTVPLQVDANAAYRLADLDILRALDELGLVMIEQPLSHDDLVDHARLQAQITTPICLDESLGSAEDVRRAFELGSCRVVNLKVSRLGGVHETKQAHDLCLAAGIPAWCGGMHEFGIGRAANAAVAGLPGCVLPGDISGSDKYFLEDLVDPPILSREGRVTIPTGPGLGVSVVPRRLQRATIRTEVISM
jgi:O-succinylbenzoate synthase